MNNKIQAMINKALADLEKGISDVEKKYGDKIDTDYLRKKFEEVMPLFYNYHKLKNPHQLRLNIVIYLERFFLSILHILKNLHFFHATILNIHSVISSLADKIVLNLFQTYFRYGRN